MDAETIDITEKNISKYFTHIYILIKKNDDKIPIDFYMKEITEKVLNDMHKSLVIWKVSISILKNKKHYDRMSIVPKENLTPFNQFNFELGKSNIMLPIFNISFKNIIPYLNNINGYNLDKIYNLILLSKYFCDETTSFKSQKHIENVINSMEESSYWEAPHNCVANLSICFEGRQFNKNFMKKMTIDKSDKSTDTPCADDAIHCTDDDMPGLIDIHAEAIATKSSITTTTELFEALDIDTSPVESVESSELIESSKLVAKSTILDNIREDYMGMISSTKPTKYIDASSILNSPQYKLYHISHCIYTKEDIYNLLSALDNKNRFFLFCNMLVSKKYSHLIINNESILSLMKDELRTDALLFRYLIGYAWLRLYFDESIKKRNLTINDEVIFTIDTASKLPVYPFHMEFPKMNPYMPIMVSDNILNPEENIGGLRQYKYDPKNTQYDSQGICTLEEFKTRLNIFTTNNPTNDIFHDIQWNKWKIAVTGSVMSACIQRRHPLVNMFYTPDDIKDAHKEFLPNKNPIHLIRYFNEYYAAADIDIMFLHEDIFEYLKTVQLFFNQIVVNICNLNSEYAEPDHIKLIPLFQIHYCVNQDWVSKNIVNDKYSLKAIQNNIDDKEIKALFEPFIQIAYDKYLLEYKTDKAIAEYPDFFAKLSSYQIIIRIYNNKTPDELYDSLKINYKYRINSSWINHPLELFKIYGTDFMNSVSQFHLPCIRALYDGSNVYMTPSCVTAHLTFMNIDYKYFTGSKDPIEIINKNRMRGFGTWLNKTEIKDLMKYSTTVSSWSKCYGKNKYSVSNLGTLPLSHTLFQPRMVNPELYYDAPPVGLDNYYNNQYKGFQIKHLCDVDDDYIKKFGIKTLERLTRNLTTINSDGSINPLQKWIIPAYYYSCIQKLTI